MLLSVMAGPGPSDKRTKGKTPLGPFLISLVLVVGAIAIYFTVIGKTPESEPATMGDVVRDRPTGAGTVPEAPADPLIGGATEELDEVEPAAPGDDTIPAQEIIEDIPADEDEEFVEEFREGFPVNTDEDFLIEEEDDVPLSTPEGIPGDSIAPEMLDPTDEPGHEAGDLEAEPMGDEEGINTIESEELVVDPNDGAPIDPDGGAAPFDPTASGPEGRDESPLTPE